MARAAAKAAEPGIDSIDPAEIEKFAALAEDWWDPEGQFRPLHALNPSRLTFIRDRAAAHFGRDPRSLEPFAGLAVLDIGCGGGLVSEPLARLGASVTGIDASPDGVRAAAAHAAESGVAVDYREAAAETLLAEGRTYDLVVTLEVVEHVADLGGFLDAAGGLVRPGGALVAATLSRTLKSFVTAIVGAEYVLRWLPRGTHDWRRFVRPSELARLLRARGLAVEAMAGLVYNPLTDTWRLDPHALEVNYMVFATRPDGQV